MEQLKLSYFSGRNVKYFNHYGEHVGIFNKVNVWLSYNSANLMLGIYPREMKTTFTKLSLRLYSSLSKTGNDSLYIYRWINKQMVVYSYNGYCIQPQKRNTLLRHATTWMDLKNIMLNQRSQTKMYIMYNYIYMLFLNRQK